MKLGQQMIPDLLDAHLALGRLTERLADPEERELWLFDALRREAINSLGLEGRLLALEDLTVAKLSARVKHRDDVGQGLDLLATSEFLLGHDDAPPLRRDVDFRLRSKIQRALDEDDGIFAGRDEEEPGDDPLWGDDDDEEEGDRVTAELSATEAIAAARKALGQGHAALAGARFASTGATAPSPALPPPLTTPWMEAAWRRMNGDLTEDDRTRLSDAVGLVDAALQGQPGLLGVAAALHELHRPGLWPEYESPELANLDRPSREEQRARRRGRWDEVDRLVKDREEQAQRMRLNAAELHRRITPAFAFCRVITPWLIQHACALPHPGPWISHPFARLARRDYQSIASLSLPDWTRRFCRTLANGLDLERARLDELHRLLDAWEGRMAHGRARRAEKTLSTLRLLIRHPALNSVALARHRGLKRRMAQTLLHDLERAGVVVETTGNYSERVWLANGLR